MKRKQLIILIILLTILIIKTKINEEEIKGIKEIKEIKGIKGIEGIKEGYSAYSCTKFVMQANGSDSNDCSSSGTACASIERGLLLTPQGGVLCVWPGHYYISSTLNIHMTTFTMYAFEGPSQTIIDGGNSKQCVNIYVNGMGVVTIDGFTFQYCNATEGGAIAVTCSIVGYIAKIKNCEFYHNQAKIGGAIYNFLCAATYENVTIAENSASDSGGGFYCYRTGCQNVQLTWNNITIVDNTGNGNKSIEDQVSGTCGEYACEYNGNRMYDCGDCYNGGNCLPSGSCVCLPGSHAPTPTCSFCDPGSYSTTQNAASCTLCEPNYYNTGYGNTGCSSCPTDTSNSGSGNIECSPPQMSDPTYDSVTSSSFNVYWTTPSLFSVSGYYLRYKSTGDWTSLQLSSSVHQYNFSDLYSGDYTIQVAGYNNEGNGTWTNEIVIATNPPTQPSIVPNIAEVLEMKSSTSFGVSWGTPSNGGSPLISYEINYKPENGTWINSTVEAETHSFQATSLLSGKYIFRIRAKSNYSFGDYSSEHSFWTNEATCPDAITTFNEVNHTQETISVNWTAPASNGGSTIINYQVAYLKDGETTWSYKLEPANTYESTIEDLIYGTYTIRVRAITSYCSTSEFSQNLSIETGAPTEPDPVTSISQTGKSSTSILISWIEPCSCGSPIIGYRLWYKYEDAEPAEDFQSIDLYSTNLYYNLDNLLSGNYTFKIQSNNSINFSVNGTEFSFSTDPATYPGNMQPPYKISGTSSEIQIGWAEPSNNGGSVIVFYFIEYKKNTTSIFDQFNTSNSSTSCTIGSLEELQYYNFRIKACNDIGCSESWSNNATYITDGSTVPGKVAQPSFLNSTSTSFAFSWTKPTDGGKDILYYTILYKLSTSGSWTEIILNVEPSATNLEYVIDDIYSGTYNVRISATNENGEGISSDSTPFSTSAATAPNPVLNLQFISSSSTSIYMTWDPPTSNGGRNITNFFVQFDSLNPNGTSGSVSTSEYVLQFNLTNLISDSYNITVYAANSIGNSTGNQEEMNTLSPQIPDKITGFTQISATSTSITLQWNQPNNNGRPILNYNFSITSYSTNTTEYMIIDPPQSSFQYKISNLLSGVFDIAISAINEVGSSIYSDVLLAQTSQPTVPGIMDPVNSTAINSTSLNVNWTKPNNGGLNITSYILSYREQDTNISNSTQLSFGSSTFEYNITGLLSGNYSIAMKAVNPLGSCNSWSTDTNVSTLDPVVPGEIESINVDEIRRHSLLFSWEVPNHGGREIEGYNLTCAQTDNLTNSAFSQVDSTVGFFDNLTTNTSYTLTISAFNSEGYANPREFVLCTQSYYPNKVTGVYLKNIEPYIAVIGWNDLDDIDITTYTAMITDVYNRTNFISLFCSFDSLIPNTNYTVKVRAEVSEYIGDWSNDFNFTTNKTVPEKVVDITATQIEDNLINLEWPIPRNNGEEITQYYTQALLNDELQNEVISLANSVSIGNLKEVTNYSIRIRAINSIGYSAWSDNYYFTTQSAPKQTSKTGLYAGLGTSFGALAIVGGVAFYWYKKRKVVKVTPTVNVYSVNDEDEDGDKDNENPKNDSVNEIVMETVETEKDLYLQSIENSTSKLTNDTNDKK